MGYRYRPFYMYMLVKSEGPRGPGRKLLKLLRFFWSLTQNSEGPVRDQGQKGVENGKKSKDNGTK